MVFVHDYNNIIITIKITENIREKVQHNGEAGWIKNQYQQNPSMKWSPICAKDVAEALRTTLNWKAPGRDQTPNFWLKQLNSNKQAYSCNI